MSRGRTPIVPLVLLLALAGCGEGKKQMLFHAGVGQRSSLNEIKEVFCRRHPEVEVNFSYKGSGYFIADIERSKEGDLYMPGEEFYLLQAVERGFITDYNPETDIAAYFMVVIVTPRGNPADIQGIEDFGRQGVRVSLGNPKACAIGIWDEKIFKKAGIWDEVKRNQVHEAKCIAEAATAPQHRVVDAALVWSSTAVLYLRDLEIIPIEPQYRGFVRLPVAVLEFAEHPQLANELKDFILSDAGAAIFRSHAYVTDPGPLDDEGFCTDGGKATEDDCYWLVQAARVCKDETIPVSVETCGHLVKEVLRQRKTKRAGSE
ncbi:MAG: molybdate ABC transporter substrate-binding protein [Candidatus Brocadiia bacterium]